MLDYVFLWQKKTENYIFKDDMSMLSSNRQQMTQTDTDTQSQTVGGAWGLFWKNRRKDGGPEGNRNSTGRPMESTNLDPWGSQSLNHQPKNIHELDLSLPVQMEQMCSLIIM